MALRGCSQTKLHGRGYSGGDELLHLYDCKYYEESAAFFLEAETRMTESREENSMTRKQFDKVVGTVVVVIALAILGPLSFRAEADNNAVAQAWIDAWNSHNPDKVVALFTEDAVVEDVTLGVKVQGLAQIRAFAVVSFTGTPDILFDLVNSTLKGGHGTIEWIFSGTDTGTGKRFRVRGVTVMDAHGTKFSRETDYWDLATILREIGLL